MEKKMIAELVDRYNAGLASQEEIGKLERCLEEGTVALTQLRDLDLIERHLDRLPDISPSMRLDDQFYSMLAEEKRKLKSHTTAFSWPDWSVLFPRLAVAAMLIVVGFGGGYMLQRPAENEQVQGLTREISGLREMVMLSLLEKESATDRLRAVSLTTEMGQVSQKVTQALFRTLNEDDNVNVRLAALEAIKPFVRDNHVREELVRSIAKQDSPMVQLELASLMAKIQEKKSVDALKKILDNDRTPSEVRTKIKESIKILI